MSVLMDAPMRSRNPFAFVELTLIQSYSCQAVESGIGLLTLRWQCGQGFPEVIDGNLEISEDMEEVPEISKARSTG